MITRKPIQRFALLAGGALLSVIVSAAGAKATTIVFTTTGSIVSFTAPVTGVYDIDAFGAQGGVNTGIVVNSAGLGAEAGGQFSLTAGQMISILVGGQGGNGRGLDGGGGGGGGSFVELANSPNTLLVAAGGAAEPVHSLVALAARAAPPALAEIFLAAQAALTPATPLPARGATAVLTAAAVVAGMAKTASAAGFSSSAARPPAAASAGRASSTGARAAPARFSRSR